MKKAFDSDKYFRLQKEKIADRISKFSNGKLYLEIGGKFLYDGHAERVLPGFDPEVKVKILMSLGIKFDILFCIISKELNEGRVWKSDESYEETVLKTLKEIENTKLPRPKIAVNLYEPNPKTLAFEEKLKGLGFTVYTRYKIEGYPGDVGHVVSKEGFGKDEYIETDTNLVVVVGVGSQSGKMSTCLGQVYLDSIHGLDSGYAKYETFPIWNRPLDHPANLAYEAATADIGDYNVYDRFHEAHYGVKAVNYNRDVEAFPIIKKLIDTTVSKENFMRTYASPTDMGISSTGECIVSEKDVQIAAEEEIERRLNDYRAILKAGKGKNKWVYKCIRLLKQL